MKFYNKKKVTILRDNCLEAQLLQVGREYQTTWCYAPLHALAKAYQVKKADTATLKEKHLAYNMD